MKQLFILSIIVLSVNTIFAQRNDFRIANWGASFEDIKAIETSSLVMTIRQDELIYKEVLDGDACEVYYMFNENAELMSGLYHFTRQYSNPQQYVELYDKFQRMLANKYGEEVDEKQLWHPSFKGLDRSSFGKEIANGNLSLSTEWNTPNGKVKISLTRGGDQQPQVQIYYHGTSSAVVARLGNKKSALAKF